MWGLLTRQPLLVGEDRGLLLEATLILSKLVRVDGSGRHDGWKERSGERGQRQSQVVLNQVLVCIS